MKSYVAKQEDIERKWWLVDARGRVLGRLASRVARILRGKHKPIFTPHVDTGDHVVVVNASEIKITGNKLKQKVYKRYSGYPGGLKEKKMEEVMDAKPEKVFISAVKGMLPRNRLGSQMLTRLRVYRSSSHRQQAQHLEKLEL